MSGDSRYCKHGNVYGRCPSSPMEACSIAWHPDTVWGVEPAGYIGKTHSRDDFLLGLCLGLSIALVLILAALLWINR